MIKNKSLEEKAMEEAGLSLDERKTLNRLASTALGGIAGLSLGAISGALGYEEVGLGLAVAGGLGVVTYLAAMYPPIVPPKHNKYRQMKIKYLRFCEVLEKLESSEKTEENIN